MWLRWMIPTSRFWASLSMAIMLISGVVWIIVKVLDLSNADRLVSDISGWAFIGGAAMAAFLLLFVAPATFHEEAMVPLRPLGLLREEQLKAPREWLHLVVSRFDWKTNEYKIQPRIYIVSTIVDNLEVESAELTIFIQEMYDPDRAHWPLHHNEVRAN